MLVVNLIRLFWVRDGDDEVAMFAFSKFSCSLIMFARREKDALYRLMSREMILENLYYFSRCAV